MSSVCLANSPLEIDSSISEMQETSGRRKDPRVGWLVGGIPHSQLPHAITTQFSIPPPFHLQYLHY